MQRSRRTLLWTCASSLVASITAGAQSLVSTGFESPGLSDAVTALATFDPDGTGSAPAVLVAGGAFPASAQGLANYLAAWNGSFWTSLGGGTDGRISALTTFDTDGAGPLPASLVVAGAFTSAGGVGANRIALWNGSTFAALGQGLDDWASTVAVFDDDGAGPNAPALYVGGDFEHAGTISALGIARWNGTNFEALGSGIDGPAAAMVVFDGALYVGGFFTTAGGTTVNGIARWTGSAWQALASGFDGAVQALAVYDPDGAGPIAAALVAGGAFQLSGSTTVNGIARWTGSNWAALGTGITTPSAYPSIRALLTVTEGGATKLYAAGLARTAGSVTAPSGSVPETPGGQAVLTVASWDGSTWATLGSGATCAANESGRALAMFDDDGDGTASLFVGGHFTVAGANSTAGVARWSGTAWTRLGAGEGLGASVHALALGSTPLPSTSASPIAAGGAFAAAGTTPANRVALWDGAAWQPLGSGVAGTILDGDARAVAWLGAELYVGGKFTKANNAVVNHVTRWNGAGDLTALGNGLDGDVHALTAFGGQIIAGGAFANSGSTTVNGIAAWSESAGAWTPLGDGVFGTVRALLVADDGSGSALYAGGEFDKAGTAAAVGVARWNGAAWTALGSGLCCGGVSSLALYGGALHAGGTIDSSGDDPVNGIARWNLGTGTWSSLGDGVSAGRPTNVLSLAVWDGVLVVGGDFQKAGGSLARHAATWNGTAWSTFGTGADGSVRAMLAVTSGTSPALWVGGDFTVIDGRATSRIARAQ